MPIPHRKIIRFSVFVILIVLTNLHDERLLPCNLLAAYQVGYVCIGMTEPVICQILGHTQTSTTQRYTHLSHVDVIQARDIM
jgi:site-specific recombinase XerD